jgi:hypothetical protein
LTQVNGVARLPEVCRECSRKRISTSEEHTHDGHVQFDKNIRKKKTEDGSTRLNKAK